MTAIGLAAAFPRRRSSEASTALAILGPELHPPPGSLGSQRAHTPVLVAGDPVTIPYRIYHEPPPTETFHELAATQRLLVASMLTRHHDGIVRQRWLKEIVASTEPFVAPFVVQLLSEYVIEIVENIAAALTEVEVQGSELGRMYGAFAASNRPFFEVVRSRATSYWQCYHARGYLDRASYPAFGVLDAMERAT